MTKIIGLTLNKSYGVLTAQELRFDEKNGIIPIKAPEGEGKTTFNNAINSMLSGKKHIYFKDKFRDNNLNAVLVLETIKGESAYLHLDEKDLFKLTIIDKAGKKVVPPSPAKFQEMISTQFNFRLDEFKNGSGKEQTEFIKELYKAELENAGIVFSTKSKNYKGSKFELYVDACNRRTDILENQVRVNDATQKALITDGICDRKGNVILNIPETDVHKIEETLSAIERELWTFDLSRKTELDKIKEVGVSLRKEKELLESKAKETWQNKVNLYNKSVEVLKSEFRAKIKDDNAIIENNNEDIADKLNVINQIIGLSKLHNFYEITTKAEIELKSLGEKSADNLLDFDKEWEKESAKLDKAPEYKAPNYTEIDSKISSKITEYKKIDSDKESKNALVAKMDIAKSELLEAKNNVNTLSRIEAYEAHRESDGICKKIMDSIIKSMVSVNLGVNGLRLDVIEKGEDFDVRLHFDSTQCKYSSYFNDKAGLFADFSETQREVLTVLLQVHELNKKETSVRWIWTNAPKTKKTFDILENIGSENGVTILHEWTTDEKAGSGEIEIKNGEVLIN